MKALATNLIVIFLFWSALFIIISIEGEEPKKQTTTQEESE